MTKTAQVYVLRVWQEAREAPKWRASLSDLTAQEKTYFASPEELVSFIKGLVAPRQSEESDVSSHLKS